MPRPIPSGTPLNVKNSSVLAPRESQRLTEVPAAMDNALATYAEMHSRAGVYVIVIKGLNGAI